MRKPTLNEKIIIKGALVKKGVPAHELVAASMSTLTHYWYRCFGKPISEYWRY